MTDAELEPALDQKWRAFLAAVRTGDKSSGRIWNELEALHEQRTPQQKARALIIAGLTAEGRCAHEKIENGVCLKCKEIVTNGKRAA